MAIGAVCEQYNDRFATVDEEWLFDFRDRHRLFFYQLEPYGNSQLRVRAVHRYLDTIQAAMDEHSIPMHRLYCVQHGRLHLQSRKYRGIEEEEWPDCHTVTLVETTAFDPSNNAPTLVIAKARHSVLSLCDAPTPQSPVQLLFNLTGTQTAETLAQWLNTFDAATRPPQDDDWRLLLIHRLSLYDNKAFIESAAKKKIAVVPISDKLEWMLPAYDFKKLRAVYNEWRGLHSEAPDRLLLKLFFADYPRIRREAFDEEATLQAFHAAGLTESGIDRDRAARGEMRTPSPEPLTEEDIFGTERTAARQPLGPSQAPNLQAPRGAYSAAWEKKLPSTSCLAEDMQLLRDAYKSDRRKAAALHARWSEMARAVVETGAKNWASAKELREKRRAEERMELQRQVELGQVDIISLDSDDSDDSNDSVSVLSP